MRDVASEEQEGVSGVGEAVLPITLKAATFLTVCGVEARGTVPLSYLPSSFNILF